jgi:hypothetical protein
LAKKLNISKSESEQVTIIGISCMDNDYRLIYFMSKALSSSFVKLEDISFYGKEGKLGDFSFYHHKQEDARLNYFLFSNKKSGQIAVTNFKNFDYFLLIIGEIDTLYESFILNSIRNIPILQAAILIPHSGLKNIEYLLEDIEMHLVTLKLSKRENKDLWVDKTHLA